MLAIHIQNDGTGDEQKGHYDYTVMLNYKVLATGKLRNHTRSWGWKSLVEAMLVDAKGSK